MPTAAWSAAREGAAVHVLEDRAHFLVTGNHRDRFLHAMTTARVKGLTPGQGNFGLAVDRGGKLVGQFMLDVEPDRIRVETAADRRSAIIDHLVAHRIADRVAFAPLDGYGVIHLVGPTGGEVLAATLGFRPAIDGDFGWVDVDIAGAGVRVRPNNTRLGLPGWDLTAAADDVTAIASALAAAGAVPMDTATFEALRVSAGVPRDGIDLGTDNVPLESHHLYALMDWDKGCYIGQEVIAMMHYRGRPNRHLRALVLPEGSPLPAVGTAVLTADGKPAGVVGSAVFSPDANAPVALAVVKRRTAAAGTSLLLEGGAEAVVRELPLGPA